jgi:drug/metabolite transporter (DMT)-like permease
MPAVPGASVHEGLPLAVALAVLASAVLHASWNALAKSVPDQVVSFVGIGLGSSGVAILVALVAPAPAAASWPYLAASLTVHVGYQAMLLNSYRTGDLSQAYPVARGSAPVLVALLAIPAVGEGLDGAQILGVVVVAGGLVGLADLRRLRESRSPALTFAFATALCIATYSILDGVGVRHSGTPVGYVSWLMAAEGLPIPLYALAFHRDRLAATGPAVWARTALGGMMSLVAYGIVVWAQDRAALAAVSALRETGVLVAVIIGALALKEPLGRRRLLAALLVAAGAALVTAGP